MILFLQLKQYEVVGRKLPSDKEANPPLYKMRIFAPERIVAKSRFWYFLRQLRKFKKMTGEIVSIKEVIIFLYVTYTLTRLFSLISSRVWWSCKLVSSNSECNRVCTLFNLFWLIYALVLDPRNITNSCQELWNLASLWLSLRDTQHVPWIPGVECFGCRDSLLSRYGSSSSCPSTCYSGKEPYTHKIQSYTSGLHSQYFGLNMDMHNMLKRLCKWFNFFVSSCQIIRVEEVAAAKCRRPQVKQFHDGKLRFPLPKRIEQKHTLPRFSHVRPKTYFM